MGCHSQCDKPGLAVRQTAEIGHSKGQCLRRLAIAGHKTENRTEERWSYRILDSSRAAYGPSGMRLKRRSAIGYLLSAITAQREALRCWSAVRGGFCASCKIQARYQKSGSTLVLVLGAIVIAAMLAVSYLIFTDNLREQAARTLDQDQREIGLEQQIQETEKLIRDQLQHDSTLDLSDDALAGSSPVFRATVLGQADTTVLKSTPIETATNFPSLKPLSDSDPFAAAQALVHLIDLTAIDKPALNGQRRLSNVQLTVTPEIAVREIPVSQFTVYSAADPFTIAPGTFGVSSQVGRIFSESAITISGAWSSSYPILAKGQITFDSGASLRVADTNSASGPIGLSTNTWTTSSVPNDFFAEARTQLDSKFITGDVLPLENVPSDQIYDSTSERVLNFTLLQAECDLVVIAQGWRPPDADGYWVMVNAPKTGASYSGRLSYPHAGGGQNRSNQSVAFVAYNNKDNNAQIFLAFDYRRIPRNISSVYLAVLDNRGKPASNAIVLVRGAQTLSGPLSIVSPHPIVIAGDFNQTASACSLITDQDVQAQPTDWGSPSVGNL
jgi:hypothetical protein